MDDFTIAIDTREQQPYAFVGAVTKTLPTGDYSIVGLEDRVTVERKSKVDAYGSLGHGRARFRREFERLSRLDYAGVVIEDTVQGLYIELLNRNGFKTFEEFNLIDQELRKDEAFFTAFQKELAAVTCK